MTSVVVHGFNAHHAHREAVAHWERRWRDLQNLLRPFPPDQRSVRLALDCSPEGCKARLVLLLPTATLTATGSAAGNATIAIDQAADRLAGEICRHKTALRREFLYHRRHRRRSDLSGIAAALEQAYSGGDRTLFTNLLRPALRELSDYARRELVIAQLEGTVRPDELTVSTLLGELIARAWRQFEHRPSNLRLEQWLTGLLHSVLDERGEEPSSGAGCQTRQDDPRLAASSGWDAADEPFWPPTETLTFADVVPVGSPRSALELASDEEQRAWILSQLRGFPRHQRRAFTLYTLEGWTLDEVAALQRRSPEEVLLDVDSVRDELADKLQERAHGSEWNTSRVL